MQCGRHVKDLSHGRSFEDHLLDFYGDFTNLHRLLWNEQFTYDSLLPHYRTQVSDEDLP